MLPTEIERERFQKIRAVSELAFMAFLRHNRKDAINSKSSNQEEYYVNDDFKSRLDTKALSYARSKTQIENGKRHFSIWIFRSEEKNYNRAKPLSSRKQKLSYVRSKIRLGFNCGVSCMPAVGIIGSLNIRVLTQLRLELFKVQLLLYSCTGWMSTQSICI